MVMENELTKKRNEAEIMMNVEDNLKLHISKLEAEVKNLRISDNEVKTKLHRREEEYNKRLSHLENDRKRESEK